MAKMKFNPETPLYTSDTKAWRIDQLDAVMANLQLRVISRDHEQHTTHRLPRLGIFGLGRSRSAGRW